MRTALFGLAFFAVAGCSNDLAPIDAPDFTSTTAPDMAQVNLDLVSAPAGDLSEPPDLADLARAADMSRPPDLAPLPPDLAPLPPDMVSACGAPGQPCCIPQFNGCASQVACWNNVCTDECGTYMKPCCGGNAQHVGGQCIFGSCGGAASAFAGKCV